MARAKHPGLGSQVASFLNANTISLVYARVMLRPAAVQVCGRLRRSFYLSIRPGCLWELFIAKPEYSAPWLPERPGYIPGN
jgi:hypothetical protein